MTRFAALFAAFVLLAPCAQAEAPQADAPAIWRVDGPQADVWFFGSIHLLPQGVNWRTPAMQEAFATAEVVVLETDVEGADPAAMQALLAREGMLPAGETLRAGLDGETRAALDAMAGGLGLPLAALEPMRPWLASITLTVQYFAAQGWDPANGVDQAIAREAAGAGKTLAYLETNEQQLGIFSRLTRAQEREFLAVTLQQLRETPEMVDDMLAAWRAGDTARLETVLNAGFDAFPLLRDALLKDRHRAWVPQVRDMLASGKDHLVVVGAAHLVGDDSIIAMLRAEGLSVEGP